MTISGVSCNNSGGDGLYINTSTNITVQDCIFNNNRRQGASITEKVNHIHFLRCNFTNTIGTAPQNGVDVEPNPTSGNYLLDVTFTDCYMTGNAGDGIGYNLWQMDSTSQPVSSTCLRCHTASNGRYGYFANNNGSSNPGGAILVQDSFSDQETAAAVAARFYASNGASLTFLRLTVTNPHVGGPDPSYGDSAGVDIIRGGGASVSQGNVHFICCNISATNGKMDHYFNFQDGSGIGTVNAQFVPGTLSGATAAPPNGLVQGVGVNTVGTQVPCS